MRTLIIHHLEPMWEAGYQKAGTSFAELVQRFCAHIEDSEYDKVILTRFEDNRLQEPEYDSLRHLIDQVEVYGYGWTQDQVDESNAHCFCDGGMHSDLVLLEDWMRLDGKVFISGAFDFECIEDLEIALEHLGVDFERIEWLIIG